jgi:hypothetical protein
VRTSRGNATEDGDDYAGYDAAMAGKCRMLSAALHEQVNAVKQHAA